MQNETTPPGSGGKKNYKETAFRVTVVSLAAAILICCLVFGTLFAVRLSGGKAEEKGYETAAAAAKKSTVEVYGGGETGSGIVYAVEADGMVVITNRHVVKTDSAEVKAYGASERLDARLLAYSDYHDIAVLKTASIPAGVEAARPSAQRPVFGQSVLAAGNALGKGFSVYDGIVSMPARNLAVKEIFDASQTKVVPVVQVSAAINAGCSGGGLYNLSGELIGINAYQSLTVSDEGALGTRPVDGIGYCVPFAIAEAIAKQAIKQADGESAAILTARLTGSGETLLKLEDIILYLSVDGLTVNHFAPSLECDAALQKGDKLVAFGGLAVTNETSAADIMAEFYRYETSLSAKADKLTALFRRGDKTITAEFQNKRLKG